MFLFFLLQSHPGTNVSVIDLFDRSSSLQPMWKQVEGFKEAIHPIMQNAEDGVHFICYSQGLWVHVCKWNTWTSMWYSLKIIKQSLCQSCYKFPQCISLFYLKDGALQGIFSQLLRFHFQSGVGNSQPAVCYLNCQMFLLVKTYIYSLWSKLGEYMWMPMAFPLPNSELLMWKLYNLLPHIFMWRGLDFTLKNVFFYRFKGCSLLKMYWNWNLSSETCILKRVVCNLD